MRPRIFWIEGSRLGLMARPRGGEDLDEEMRSLRATRVEILCSLLTDDESAELELSDEVGACMRCGLELVSLPIADRGVPADMAEVRRVVRRLAEKVAGHHTVVVHCRAGIGRSAMIVAAILCDLGSTAEDAWKSIATARRCDVPDTLEQREWMERHFPKGGKDERHG